MPNIDADTRDKTSPVWDMSQERALLENLVSQRFHIFLIFASILLAASLNSKTQVHLQIILTFGAFFSWWIALAFSRVLARLDQALRLLAADETHPFAIINTSLNKSEAGRAWVLHFFWATCLAFSIAAVLAWANILHVATGAA